MFKFQLIPLNEQFLCIYDLNLGNSLNEFHEINYARGFRSDKSIYDLLLDNLPLKYTEQSSF